MEPEKQGAESMPKSPTKKPRQSRSKAEPAARGRPEARPGGEHSFTARLPSHTHRVLRLIAAREDTSVNDLLTRAAEEWIKRYPDHKQVEALADRPTSEDL